MELHFGPERLKSFFKLLPILMLPTIEHLFDQIMLLAGFLNQLNQMLMVLEVRIKEPFLENDASGATKSIVDIPIMGPAKAKSVTTSVAIRPPTIARLGLKFHCPPVYFAPRAS